jgi:hypothetical protein
MELHAQISCAMPRELARKGVGWQDRAVYTEAIYYGRENLTDGVIARADLRFWMPDMAVKERTRRLDALLAAGALINHPDGWQFPDHVWRKWGKTRAEVEKKRAEEAERLRKHREKVKAAREAAEAAYEERTDVRDEYVHGAYETPEPQPYPEPQPEPYPDPFRSSSRPELKVVADPQDDDDLFTQTVKIILKAKENDSQPRVPGAWRITVNADIRHKHGSEIRRLLGLDLEPVAVAAEILESRSAAIFAASQLGMSA